MVFLQVKCWAATITVAHEIEQRKLYRNHSLWKSISPADLWVYNFYARTSETVWEIGGPLCCSLNRDKRFLSYIVDEGQ